MGPPIRHASHILNEIDARTKLLITLSDGHPEDRDGYRGDYGIEDTRRALIEAKERGIQPFCITIDKEASSYLPHMFGEVSYVVLDDVRRLPNKITEIYRKLTT
jgi:nitric oxide reductase NorD protein